ncbi:3-hydroxyacyl-CoA dehydrogenase family protein [Rhabdobacter roseus]|uniref:3-hydroxybutyryl-CoA dehydrogenase n=1 Tax=Rhabdobacter roseus TaxID=1655419 RepID=A0A840TTL4_9BACT|nr:3-hydroxyacyl-CoA dehydrogenase family protein [Rhabdobacter roseus]MBB5284613.1 3-hydroxybutyryl-CoA dehydrogenase [Rhabdobacter roseus]
MKKGNPHEISVGVVGLGLMGSSIVVALLLAGHRVVAIAPLPEDKNLGPKRINEYLAQCAQSGMLAAAPAKYLAQLTVTDDYAQLADCRLVLECVIEKLDVKKSVFSKIATYLATDAIIGSNTSAIPISTLQQYVPQPERFLGIHWAEPAYLTRFLEITCGQQTTPANAEWVLELAHHWGKEPTLLRKDVRGFITNRLMYAVYREIFHLIENQKATLEDVDKAFRYDAGSWMTLMGIFRRMDYLGLADYAEMLKTAFPQLSTTDQVPALMQRMVDTHARGVQNARGLYPYTEEEARQWEEAFALFNQDIYHLSSKYPVRPLGRNA